MAQASLAIRPRTPWTLPRLAIAAVVAAALMGGALNLRPIFEGATGAGVIAPAVPSAVDALVGVPERAETALDARIATLQQSLRDGDERTQGIAATQLGQAYLQKARETGDPGYYPKAEALFTQALDADAENAEALVGLGTLALARHQFSDALDWGEQARTRNPYHAPTYGVIADAQIELGKYDEAVQTVQAMVDLRPDLGSYARVSYLRELMGDQAGSLAAMEQAATAGSGYPENVAWVRVQLGNLRFDGGFLMDAAREYDTALAAVPGYAPAVAGKARVAAAQGDLTKAAELYAGAVQTIPLPEFVVAYGDVLEAAGKPDEAAAQFALVDAMQRIYAANGVDTDLELALYTADHGSPEDLPRAVEQAQAAVAARPSVVAWDVLAWTLYRSGELDEAAEASTQALRLGTPNALMHFHAGMIAAARGDDARAITHLETALEINPSFSVRYAPEARATLDRLQVQQEEVIL
jgi:tetratricopeptide (TPR) repeat protein